MSDKLVCNNCQQEVINGKCGCKWSSSNSSPTPEGSANNDVAIRLRNPEVFVDACDEAADLLDWAETLLCNSLPMPHCSQSEWDKLITNWRDRKHGLSPNTKGQP